MQTRARFLLREEPGLRRVSAAADGAVTMVDPDGNEFRVLPVR